MRGLEPEIQSTSIHKHEVEVLLDKTWVHNSKTVGLRMMSPARVDKGAETLSNDTEAPVLGPKKPTRSVADHPLAVAWRKASYVWSSVLLAFALVVQYYAMAMNWTNPPWGQGTAPAAVNIAVFTVLLFWVALLEGGQVALVGLASVDMDSFMHSHPRTYRCCKVVFNGPNLERFIVGRQFLLVFVIFMISRIGGSTGADNTNGNYFYIGDWKWEPWADVAFFQNSILLMVIIIIPGQLVSQLIASDKMLAFLELPYAAYYTVVLPSLGMEALGITHTAYILRDFFVRAAGKPVPEGDKAQKKNWLFYCKAAMSIGINIVATVFIVKGLFARQTNATTGVGWDNLPGYGAFLLCTFFLFFSGCCEGFQIAAVTLAKLPSSELRKYPIAHKTTQLLYAGRNLQAFLVGRQVFVAMMMVLLGRSTGYAGANGRVVTGNDWGVGAGFTEVLLQTGILGAIFVVNVGQLSFRMAAAAFPILFINNHVMHMLLKIALLVEATGAFNACWPLAWALDVCLRLRSDPFDGDIDVMTPKRHFADRQKSLGAASSPHTSSEKREHVSLIVNSVQVSYV